MIHSFSYKAIHSGAVTILILLVVLLVQASSALAGQPVPVELVLHKSSLLKFNKRLVLVTLANTRKNPTQKDSAVQVSLAGTGETGTNNFGIPVAEQALKGDGESSNTNMYVIAEVLSPHDLKLDGIATGNTSMIVWTQDEADETPTPDFYDIRVVGNRSEIESQLKELAPEEDISVHMANDTVILNGTVKNEQTRLRAEKIAQAYAPKVQNYLSLDDPPQILLQVKVAQVDKTSLKSLGVSFMVKGRSAEMFSNLAGAPTGGRETSSFIQADGYTSSSKGSGTGISGDIGGLGGYYPLDTFQLGAAYFKGGVGSVLKALATKGHAKILAEPNLLVKSGQEGNFLAGSRIPYSVVTGTGGLAATTIVYESVGIKIKFKPELLENGLISLKIDPAAAFQARWRSTAIPSSTAAKSAPASS